jgi:O-antigen/teichoic acid export membrane protein
MTAPSAQRIIAANSIGYGIALVVSFIQAPFLIHQLGDVRYGIWTLVGLITGYYGLLDFGTRGGVGYFVARARATGGDNELAEITSSAFWFLAATAVLVLAIGVLGLWLFPRAIDVPQALWPEARTALLIALLTMALSLPLDVFSAVVNGCRRGEIISLSETVTRVLTMACIFALLPRHTRLDLLAALNLGAKLVVWCIAYFTASRLESRWSLRWTRFRRGRLTEIVSYGLRTFVGNVAGTIVERLDTLVIAVAMGAKMVTFYVIGQALVTYLGQGVNSVTLALTPFFADLNAKADDERTRVLFFTGTRAASLTTGLIGGGLLAFCQPFLAHWVGSTYITGAWTSRSDVVLVILLIAMTPRFLLSAGHQYLFGTNQQGYLARVTAIEGVVNLSLSLLLVKPLGLFGVALGSAIPSLVSHGWFVPRYLARSLQISPRQLFLEGQSRGLLTGSVVLLAGLASSQVLTPDTWWRFFVDVTITLALSAPIIWRVGLAESDRALVRRIGHRPRAAAAS